MRQAICEVMMMRYVRYESEIKDMMSDIMKSTKETVGKVCGLEDGAVSDFYMVKLFDVCSEIMRLTCDMFDIAGDVTEFISEVSKMDSKAEDMRYYGDIGDYEEEFKELVWELDTIEEELISSADYIGLLCNDVDRRLRHICKRVETIADCVGDVRRADAIKARVSSMCGDETEHEGAESEAVLECCEGVLDAAVKMGDFVEYCASVCEDLAAECSEIKESLM